jgi:alginate O-acetyltransferase complex protein AlgI
MNLLFNGYAILIILLSLIGFYGFRKSELSKLFLVLPTAFILLKFGAVALVSVLVLLTFTQYSTYLLLTITDEDKQTRLYWICFIILIAGLVVTEYINQQQPVLGVGLGLLFFLAAGWISDAYLGRIKQPVSYLNFVSYFLFFPKYIAGPVERSANFYQQLLDNKRGRIIHNLENGIPLILLGLFKKMVVADYLLQEADIVAPENYSSIYLILFAVIHFVKIFADFSGMIDVVRGIAALFGYQLLPNFNQPFNAIGFKDYWNRWHMSLSGWVLTYFYQPLSYAFRGVFTKATGAVVVILSFLLITVWHGLTFNYLIFGMLHAGFILAESAFGIKWINDTNSSLKMLSRIPFIILLSLVTLFFTNHPVQFPIGILKTIFSPQQLFTAMHVAQFKILIFNLILIAVLYLSSNWFDRKYALFSLRNGLILILLVLLWPENPKTFIYEF